MREDPYIHVLESDGAYSAYFIVVLNSISPRIGATKEFTQTVLNQQADFIATLVGIGKEAAIELRYVCNPDTALPQEGLVNTAIRLRVYGSTPAKAKSRALALYRTFFPNVLSISGHYSWRTVQSKDEYASLVPENTSWHVGEMLRRERFEVLENIPESIMSRRIGFAGNVKKETKTTELGKAYVCFPFLRNFQTLRKLFKELLYQQHSVVVAVVLTPTRATDAEYKFMLEQLLACERYIQLPLHGSVGDPASFYPSLRNQSSILADHIQDELNTLRDDVFLTTIHLLSEAPLSLMLCESVGVTITEHLQTNDPDSDLSSASKTAPYSGGYEWVRPKSQAERRRVIGAIAKIEFSGISNGILGNAYRIRRLFDINQASCAFCLPVPLEEEFPGVKTCRVNQLPPPTESQSGLSLGVNEFGSVANRVCMRNDDRLRHTYVVGKTGTGKSTFLKNSIMQDILAGEGVGVFDPHGELVDEIIDHIPAGRIKDVVLIKPELRHCSIGLNLLDVETELEKDSIINYLVEVFQAIFNMDVAGGPVFEMYFRNAMLLLLQQGSRRHTIMDLHRIFEDQAFRNAKLDSCSDPMVVAFWKGLALKAGGEASFSNVAPYITSKLVRLTHTFSMRRIFSQSKSTIDFEDIIENGKILLVDLSKGKLGGLSSSFLGMTLIKLIQMVAFRRSTAVTGESSRPFYLYFDEFQNLATPSFLDLLSESRKYGLSMMLANQYIEQIPENIRDAILGNVGAIASFRVGLNDAKLLEDSFAPSVAASHFINLPNFNAYVSMLKNGEVCRPFNIETENTTYKVTPNAADRILKNMKKYTTPTK